MKNFDSLTRIALHRRTVRLAKLEQKSARHLLSHLHEVRKRRVYAELGYSSLWEYVVKGLGFDEGGASQRIRAMELMVTVPEAKRQLADGTLSIAKAAAVQSHIKSCEVKDRRAKTEILMKVRDCSVRDTRETLKKLAAPEALPLARGVYVGFEADEELQKMFTRVRELKGQMATAEMMKAVFGAYLKQIDPLVKPAKVQAPKLDPSQDAKLARGDGVRARGGTEIGNMSDQPKKSLVTSQDGTKNMIQNNAQQSLAFFELINKSNLVEQGAAAIAANSRYFAIDARRAATQRAQGQCEWVSPVTGRRCECRYKLQYDHRVPHKLGGASTVANIQVLCAVHNGWRTRHLGGSTAQHPKR